MVDLYAVINTVFPFIASLIFCSLDYQILTETVGNAYKWVSDSLILKSEALA